MRKQLILLVLLVAVTVFSACAHGRKTTRKKVKKTTTTTTVTNKGLTAISMRRGACFGRCPEYVLTINSNGLAEYKGIRNAEKIGVYQKNIGAAAAQGLLNEFMAYRIDTCGSQYTSMIADAPGLSYTLMLNGKQKTIGNANFGPPYLSAMSTRMDALGSVDASWKKISSDVSE